MDVPRLEAFLEIARLGSMRSASRSLHLGQPALSARIATLEDEIDARLFERTKRGVRLTLAGRALLPHAERAMEAIEAGRSAVSQVEQGDEGELVIAAASAINSSVVPELLARLRRFHPGVHLYVRTGSAERIVELVAFGSAHLGLIRETRPLRDTRLRVTPLYEERLLLTARPEHPFVAEGPIPMARLADATLIFFDRASDDYELSQSLLREAGVTPYGVIEVDGVDTARRLVARGLGVALLPSTAAVPEFEAGRLAPVGLADVPQIRRRVIALERAEPSTWPPVVTLRGLLADVATFVPGAA
ncbi:MAG TPA: LysR family transcriptional regulator [Candidatus Limnocylindrales bacterium]|nr:LysR family transcriptional regulator [Candidatus Limnocylindrales bacterium]